MTAREPRRTPVEYRDPETGEVQRYGFEWGPIRVIRAAEHRGYRSLLVETDYARVEVVSSPTGRSVRVYQRDVL